MTGRVVGWARATGLLLALVCLVCVFAAPALAGTTVVTPRAARPAAGTIFGGVACSRATRCLAVGYSYVSDGGVVVPITRGIPGAARPVTRTFELEGVACSSATSCLAVGYKDPFDVALGVLVPVTNGIPGAATPVTGTFFLGGVACSSATSCVAVGYKAFVEPDGGVVVPITNGIPGAATPVSGTARLVGVACSSATSCLAVSYTGSREGNQGVVVTITNGTPGPTLFAGTSYLRGVTCLSATSCLAVGDDSFSNGGGVVVPVTYAPGVSGYRLTRNRFVVGGGSAPKAPGAAKANKHEKGTTFRYTLSEAAVVKIVIARRRLGRRKHKKFVAPTRKLRHASKCTRLSRRGTLTRTSHEGANSVAFTGRIRSTALTPGSYQATLTATDAAHNTSRARTIRFTIVKR